MHTYVHTHAWSTCAGTHTEHRARSVVVLPGPGAEPNAPGPSLASPFLTHGDDPESLSISSTTLTPQKPGGADEEPFSFCRVRRSLD